MTSGHRRSEVDAEFREAIGQLLRCVASEGLVAFPGWQTPAGQSRVLRFRPDRSRLRQIGDSRLFLYIEYVYIVVEGEAGTPFAQTLSYIYTVFDAREQRILGWHYHPDSRTGETVSIPHLHIYVDTELGGRTLSKLHLPMGHVGPADVVTFLIEELAVEPREEYRRAERGEPRWRRILRRSSETLGRLQSDA